MRVVIAAQEIQRAQAVQMAIADSVNAIRHRRESGGGQEAAIHVEDVPADERCGIAQQEQ
jgi:hypothetical protein